jgi:hypothetical protein
MVERGKIRTQGRDPELSIVTDASNYGYGGYLENQDISGTWNREQSLMHINQKELLAVFFVMRAFLGLIWGKVILIETDNMTVIAYLNKQGGTKSRAMWEVAEPFLRWLETHQIEVRVKHIAGIRNVRADQLSRGGTVKTEWSLCEDLYQSLWDLWGIPEIDMFATAENHKLPRYISPFPDNQAWEVNAMSLDWTGLQGYCFPPTGILEKVLLKIQKEECIMTVICPLWMGQSWHYLLPLLSVDYPRRLPLWDNLLQQRGELHPNPQVLLLHAWKLSKSPSLQRDFQTKLQKECQNLKKSPPSKFIRENGECLVIGAKEGISIPAMHL